MKTVTLTELRKDIFRLVDEVVATGEPLVIERKGKRLTLNAERQRNQETREERADRWRRFWDQPPRPGSWDFTVEEFNKASAESWEWDPDKKFRDL